MTTLPEMIAPNHPTNQHTVTIPDYMSYLFKPKRYKVAFGGRGGTKSWTYCQALVIRAAQSKTRILCTREFQQSIRESVIKLLGDTISRMGLDYFFDVGVNFIKGKNGSEFIFEGLKNNVTKIKSTEGVDIVFVEEAEAVTEYSWDVLLPTIRKPGSEVWLVFNPFDEMDSTYDRFVTPYYAEIEENGFYEDATHYILRTSYKENPWFPDELRDEMEKCKKENYNKYLHIWEGEPSVDFEDSLILPEWFDAAVDAHKKLKWHIRGIKAIGFDPADEGNDKKAMSIRHGPLVKDVVQWGTGNLEDGVDKIYQTALSTKSTDVCYDSIGVGAGCKALFARLKGNNTMTFQPFNGANSPDHPDQRYKEDRLNGDVFRNKRAQYYWYLRDRFESTYRAVKHGEYFDPEEMISINSEITDLKLLKGELTRIQRKRGRSESMSILIESKQDMKARGLRSPNMADSLVYAFATKINTASWSQPLDYSRMDKGIR